MPARDYLTRKEQFSITAKRRNEIFNAICQYKKAHDGNSPPVPELARLFDIQPIHMQNDLNVLHDQGRIRLSIVGEHNWQIEIVGGHWSPPAEALIPPQQTAHPSPKITPEFAADNNADFMAVAARLEDDVPDNWPDFVHAFRHYRRASKMHLHTIYDLEDQLGDLRRRLALVEGETLQAENAPPNAIRARDLIIEQQQGEIARLKTELEHATTAWIEYQNRIEQDRAVRLAAVWQHYAVSRLAGFKTQVARQKKLTPVNFGTVTTAQRIEQGLAI